MTKSLEEKVIRNEEVKQPKSDLHKKALVIGGGIAGIRAALDIANAGFPVVLMEKRPTIGGHMAQLARIFPKMDLATDVLTPLMNEVGHHPNVRLFTLSEVIGLEGHLGNFRIRLKRNPRLVDPGKCDLCKERGSAQCVEVCPVTIPSEFDEGLTLRKAIYIPFPQAIPLTYTIDENVCISCGKCAQPDVCGPGAVNLAEEEEIVEEDVGVVIVTTGYELCGQESVAKYGVNECPDVITSLQFERFLSPEGPTAGIPKRPSDGKVPKKIAFIHCAGSRGQSHMHYMKAIRSAYLAKQAILFKKLVPDGEAHSLYGDVGAVGENYEQLKKRAREEAGVNYVQAEVSRIYEQNGKVKILGVDSQLHKSIEMEVDMVVLALPMVPSPGIKDLADQNEIRVDEPEFPPETHPKLLPVESATSGIFVAGCAQTPMDIQSTMTQARAAAEKALMVLTQMEHMRGSTKEKLEE